MMKMSWRRSSLAAWRLDEHAWPYGAIVLNIGYDLGRLPLRIFTMLALMAIITTLMTGPLVTVFGKVRGMAAA